MSGTDRLDGEKKLEGMFGNRKKSVAFVESSGRIILGIHKKSDDARLFGNESRSVYRFGKQQFAVTLFLLLARDGKSRQSDGRESVQGVVPGPGGWELLRVQFAQREGKETEDGRRAVGEDKGTRDPLLGMLTGCRLEKSVQFSNTAGEA